MKESSIVVLISAGTEWRVVLAAYPKAVLHNSPFGTYFYADIPVRQQANGVLFFQGGWGKINAAASTQYAIDHFAPQYLINLGTCGGFEGEVQPGDIILADRTIVYDIVEQMGDPQAAITAYTTEIDLSWLGTNYPSPVTRTTLISADQDLVAEQIPNLIAKYQAVAGDWESGAIAYIANCNQIRCLILRGVSDIVGPGGGEAYGNIEIFRERTKSIMDTALNDLPGWIALLP
ncbi:MAG: 5'-methylthioadenosine/S-adenosylhomocysteine nucleosidase [Chloroflexi bacterium]|nr:5'-methylthioadenosine/S-adenosylhomocysteine nucleosidase [Chloroflexota bacterium]